MKVYHWTVPTNQPTHPNTTLTPPRATLQCQHAPAPPTTAPPEATRPLRPGTHTRDAGPRGEPFAIDPCLLDGGDSQNGQAGDVVAALGLADLEPLGAHVVAQQVADLLAVDLQHLEWWRWGETAKL